MSRAPFTSDQQLHYAGELKAALARIPDGTVIRGYGEEGELWFYDDQGHCLGCLDIDGGKAVWFTDD